MVTSDGGTSANVIICIREQAKQYKYAAERFRREAEVLEARASISMEHFIEIDMLADRLEREARDAQPQPVSIP